MQVSSSVLDIPRRLEFQGDSYIYGVSQGELVQTPLMEYQQHLIGLLTVFLNSGYRRGFGYDWKYLVQLEEVITEQCGQSAVVDSSDPAQVARNLAYSYELFSRHRTALASSAATVQFPLYQGNANDRMARAMQAIQGSFQAVAGNLVGAYAHGSVGSSDYNAYSDIDLLVILSAGCLGDEAELQAVRRAVTAVCKSMYTYDPLQHHGVFVLSEFDLDFYPESYLPLAVLENASALVGDGRLSITRRDSGFDALRTYAHGSAILRQSADKKHTLTNLDRIKRFNSNLLLLPSLYLETRGIYAYKRESFEIIKEYISDEAGHALRVASQVREAWRNTGLNFSLERGLLQLGIVPQRYIRAFFSRSVDRAYTRPLLGFYNKQFWCSFSQLLDEMDQTCG